MKIGKYISDLLFENDFVILPDVGEFSTKYIPAKFIPELKKVESPSKVITFNERNKTGGGLLIEYIAKKEDISSIQSREFVGRFVSEMRNSFNEGKKVELENVGAFYRDEHGMLVFEPDTSINYLSDSIGMTPVKEPVKKSEEEAKSELDKVIEEVSADVDTSSDMKKEDAHEKEKVQENKEKQDEPKPQDENQKEEDEKEEDDKNVVPPVKPELKQTKEEDKTDDQKEEEKTEKDKKEKEAKEEPEEKKISSSSVPSDKDEKKKEDDEPKRDPGMKSHQPVIKTVSSSDPQSNKPGVARPKPMNFPKPGSRERAGVSSGNTNSHRTHSEQKAKEGGLPPALKWVAFTVVPLLIIIIVLALNYEYIFGDKSFVFNGDKDVTTTQQTDAFSDEQSSGESAGETAMGGQTEADQADVSQAVPSTPEQGRMIYYVIVGSFEEEHSALILAEELRSEGAVNARVFPVNPQGFYRVAYGFYYDLDEAERVLQDAKQISENAWILHRQN